MLRINVFYLLNTCFVKSSYLYYNKRTKNYKRNYKVYKEFFKKFNKIADEGYEDMAKKCAVYAILLVGSVITLRTGLKMRERRRK